MKKILMILTAVAAFSSTSYADITSVKAKDYTCAELTQLVQDEGAVHIFGFGSLVVYAKANVCSTMILHGEHMEAYQTSWRTSDVRFCNAGYSCRVDWDFND